MLVKLETWVGSTKMVVGWNPTTHWSLATEGDWTEVVLFLETGAGAFLIVFSIGLGFHRHTYDQCWPVVIRGQVGEWECER